MDIGLNSDFDLELDDRNDLPTVSAREEFEQRLALQLTVYFERVIGTIDRKQAVDLLRLQIHRVVDDFSELAGVAQVIVAPSEEIPNQIDVAVVYDTGEEFSFNLTE